MMTSTQKNNARKEVKKQLDAIISQATEFVRKAKDARKNLKSGPITMSALSQIPNGDELGCNLTEFSEFLKRLEYDL